MKKCISLVLLLFIVNIAAFAQMGQYQRKSVTSIGSVLFKSAPSSEITDIIKNRFKANIEIERFDYNTLPESVIEDFLKAASASDLSQEAIIRAMENRLLPKLQEVLNAVREERAKGNLTEAQLATAAVDKMKGSGITAEDVLKVLNSAYIYLPVVTSVSEKKEDKKYEFTIKGYILWYQVKTDGSNYKIELVNSKAEVKSGMDIEESDKMYPLKRRSVDGQLYAKIIAINTWAKNLAVDMKKMPDFSLGGDVKNIEGGYIEAGIGTKEGVGLDDGYDVVEVFENADGTVKAKEIGFVRADNIGNNRQDPYATTKFKKYISGDFERGQTLKERPNLGLDITIRPKFAGVDISKAWGYEDDIKSSFGIDAVFSLNLAKFTNISQLFLNIEGGAAFLSGDPSKNYFVYDNAELYEPQNPFIWDAYLTISKKFWINRVNFEIGAGYGYNALIVNMKYKGINPWSSLDGDNSDETLTAYALGAKFDLSINYLVNPDLQFGLYAGYKLTSDIVKGKFKDNDIDFSGDLANSNFSGLNLGIQFSYALPSFGVDLMSGLTARQIDY